MRRVICGMFASVVLVIAVGCTGASNSASVPKIPDPKPTSGPTGVGAPGAAAPAPGAAPGASTPAPPPPATID